MPKGDHEGFTEVGSWEPSLLGLRWNPSTHPYRLSPDGPSIAPPHSRLLQYRSLLGFPEAWSSWRRCWKPAADGTALLSSLKACCQLQRPLPSGRLSYPIYSRDKKVSSSQGSPENQMSKNALTQGEIISQVFNLPDGNFPGELLGLSPACLVQLCLGNQLFFSPNTMSSPPTPCQVRAPEGRRGGVGWGLSVSFLLKETNRTLWIKALLGVCSFQ